MNTYEIGNYKIWNPWRGCVAISEACRDCFITHKDSFDLTFCDYPLETLPTGQVVTVCLQSDFFILEADHLRPLVWNRIKANPNLIFLIITKRVNRIQECLPDDWGDGYENVILSATVETQSRAVERLSIFEQIPCKHRWISCSPMLEPLNLRTFLQTSKFELVEVLGERTYNYASRPLNHEWVVDLRDQCIQFGVGFVLLGVGSCYIYNTTTILQDGCKCYNSPVARNLNVDYHVPVVFNLSGTPFSI